MVAVQGEALVARLLALTPVETLALVDAHERMVARIKRQGWGSTIPKLLRAVRLLRERPGDSDKRLLSNRG